MKNLLKNKSYVRFLQISQHYPRGGNYECDEKDIEFLRTLFPQKFSEKLTSNKTQDQICRSFEKYIINLEEEKFNDKYKLEKVGHELSKLDQDKIKEHWSKRCNFLKRPLLRKYWKPTQENSWFGKVDDKKIAFTPRNATHKTNRRSQKLTEEEIIKILHQLEKENKQAQYLAKSIVLREELKYAQLCMEYKQVPKDNFKKIDTVCRKAKELINSAEKPDPVPQPPKIVEEQLRVPKQPVQYQQPIPAAVQPVQKRQKVEDLTHLISSTVVALKKYDFKLSDFSMKNIDKLQKKIREIRNNGRDDQHHNYHQIDLSRKPQKMRKPELQTLFLVKRTAFDNPENVYIEKINQGMVLDQRQRFRLENFQSEAFVERHYGEWGEEYSGFKLSGRQSKNQFNYQGNLTSQRSNYEGEQVKSRFYRSWIQGFEMQEEGVMGIKFGEQQCVGNLAADSLKKMDLVNRFKSFRKKMKVDGSK